MSRKIARITNDKKLLLANEVVEDNAKTSLNSDGRLDTNEIIEYPAELEGGRNLVKKSDKFRAGACANGITASITSEGYLQIVTTSGNGNWHTNWFMDLTGIKEQFKEGDNFVISFTIKSPNSTAKPLIYLKAGMGYYPMQGTISTEFSQIYYTGKWKKANRFDPHLGWGGTAGTYIIKNWKIEKSTKATPWTPAPEDLGLNYPDSIQNFNSSISGNNIIAPEFIEGYPFVKPVIDDSLVLWLDGSTGNNYEQTSIWKDLSGNGNDGELVNFGYTEDSGWVDGGLKFDGVDDYVQLPDLDLNPENFTIQVDNKIRVFNGGKVITENMEDIAYTWKQFEGMTWEEVINL